jgi:FdhD protein
VSGVASDPSFAPRAVLRFDGADRGEAEDLVVVEEPLEIRVGDEPIAVTMRTPGSDPELAAGFCLTEGIVAEQDDLESVEACALADYGNVVRVTLSKSASVRRRDDVERARRELYLTSSCGLCGVQSIDRIERRVRPPEGRFRVTAAVLASLPGRMQEGQGAFAATGGLHAAALFTIDGSLIVLREDVGRHNAVDKVIGHQLLLGKLPFDPGLLLVSGRASFEVIQKAAAGGIAVVCAVSAPSSLAIDLARRLDLTLVGFLRPGRMNVYHDRGRIDGP